jgi:hypothetical protein
MLKRYIRFHVEAYLFNIRLLPICLLINKKKNGQESMTKSYVEEIRLCFYKACNLLLRLCGRCWWYRLRSSYPWYGILLFQLIIFRIQNLQRTHMENLYILGRITPFQSCFFSFKHVGVPVVKKLPNKQVRRFCSSSPQENFQNLLVLLNRGLLAIL